ncbi:hypothetical protein ABZX39_33600 [Streptomyces collinus]|uniref:hypothetical protein n=1 Tax=Streptomyces collinus TaxID=42684 RepID=UPI0033B322B2
MSEPSDVLRAAEERFEQAAAELDRQQLTAKLCKHARLAYASLTEDQLGPMLVTYQHRPLGEVHTTSPSALKDWYAQPYLPDGSLGASDGPYVNARAAAASLIPERQTR